MTLRYFSFGIALTIGAFALFALFLPSNYTVNVSILVNAPVSTVYDQIADLHQWEKWAFTDSDSNSVEFVFNDVQEGKGAEVTWLNEHQPQGKMQITAAMPPESVNISVSINESAFGSEATFSLRSEAENTLVTWEENGDFGMNLMARLFAFGADFEGVTEERYQASLEKLKVICENQ